MREELRECKRGQGNGQIKEVTNGGNFRRSAVDSSPERSPAAPHSCASSRASPCAPLHFWHGSVHFHFAVTFSMRSFLQRAPLQSFGWINA